MTVKEMGPAVGAFSPALFMLVRRNRPEYTVGRFSAKFSNVA